MQVYQALARLLLDSGVNVVFGVMGDGNMHWLAEYRTLPGARWRPAWHEAGAVGMADGHATAAIRLAQPAQLRQPAIGVATVTMGPGLAQALGALTAAVRTRSRVLIITAEPEHESPPHSQDIDQRSWAQTAGATYRLVSSAADLRTALEETIATARSGRPAVLSVPVTLMTTIDDGQRRAAEATDLGRRLRPADDAGPAEALRSAAQLLAASRRPVILLGRGAVLAGAVASAVELARRIGACLLTTVAAKGCLAAERDPFDLGLTGTMAHPGARSVAASADVVLSIGAALDAHNTSVGSFFGRALMIRIDNRPPAQLWRPCAGIAEITGDAATAIAELTAGVPASRRTGLRSTETAQLLAAEPARRAALAKGTPDDGLNPWAVVGVIDETIPADAHIVTGVGHFWYFAAPYLSAQPGRTFHFGYGFGLIGQGVPVGVGAAVAAGSACPTIAIEGDGSFLMNSQELQSAVRFGTDLLVLVLNNTAYGSEYLKLGIAGLDPAVGAFDKPVDIVRLAAALGATARRVRTLAELRAALTACIRAGGVRVLDIGISRSMMSEAYQRMHLSSPADRSELSAGNAPGASR